LLEYLAQLMEEGKFEECLRLSEQQLLRGGMTVAELATLNLIICRCRLGLNNSYGAINSGLLAAKLARDTREWDTYGRALLNVGTAYMGSRQYALALETLYNYFEFSHLYNVARRFEGAIWRTIGLAHQHKGEPKQAIDALTKAHQWFAKQGIDQSAFNALHDLVHTYLSLYDSKGGSLEPVRQILAQQKAISRKYPAESYLRAYHLNDESAYYLRAKRWGRALVCAMKAIDIRKNDNPLHFYAYMNLCSGYKQIGEVKQALSYVLAARMAAIRGKHYDLEYVAAQTMAELIRVQKTELVREFDEEYQAMGIDLCQYLSPALLRREN
jgi:tetratricopeptide (TPR) repeat protein